MKKLLCVLLTVAMVMGLCACGGGSSEGGKSEGGANVIKVGVFEPATGENGAGGMQEVLGARYANQVAPTITLGGTEYTIELVEVDNQSDKSAAVTAAQQLVSAGVIGVLGSYGSGVSIAAGPTFAEAEIPAIGCSCTNPQVTSDCEWYYRVCFLDPFQGTVMATYCNANLGYTKAAVICQNGDDYSTGLANYFKDGFKALGGEVVYEGTYNTNEMDFNAILTAAKKADPEVIFCPSSIATAGMFIKQARELGITCPLMAGDTWENATIIENAGADNCEGVTFSTFFDENDATAGEFVKGFKEFLNGSDENLKLNGGNDIVAAVSALGYDAYMAMYEGLKALDGKDITGANLKEALAGVNFAGVTGNIAFDEKGDSLKDTAYIKTMSEGAFKFLGTQSTDGTFNAAN